MIMPLAHSTAVSMGTPLSPTDFSMITSLSPTVLSPAGFPCLPGILESLKIS
jgi:hypothetical protein